MARRMPIFHWHALAHLLECLIGASVCQMTVQPTRAWPVQALRQVTRDREVASHLQRLFSREPKARGIAAASFEGLSSSLWIETGETGVY